MSILRVISAGPPEVHHRHQLLDGGDMNFDATDDKKRHYYTRGIVSSGTKVHISSPISKFISTIQKLKVEVKF